MAQQGSKVTIKNTFDAESLQSVIEKADQEMVRRFSKAIVKGIAKRYGVPAGMLGKNPNPIHKKGIEFHREQFNRAKNFGGPYCKLAEDFAFAEYKSYLKKLVKAREIESPGDDKEEMPSEGDAIMQSIRNFCR